MKTEKMTRLKFAVILFSILFLGACCSKKGACPAIEFNSFELLGFPADDITDGATFIRYEPNSNFTVIVDSTYYMPEATGNNAYKITTGNLPVSNDYGIRVKKIGKLYKIGNFTGEKISCGKCFMRANNQFGYVLNGYSVNNKGMAYDGIIRINK
ncbi:MAG: hypothetical protein WC716_03080 [Chitinophagaceae bacterium]